ncbi:hypothetical protein C8A00DRAFT_31508 [Chaetomidium leptoderma]|uniref:Uncharacterized protein n=1 Tax=Chaetomidium leptoderma TaxID=669021 RepID=A0AAN6VQR8_9PEZI|nr:hypothetical protein C8A00DRAFT_31508 [Chaetomidium leptoderma]
MSQSPFSTPKRKRNGIFDDGMPKLNTTTQFTFDLDSAFDDGNASPRTRVAHRFRGLALGAGGGGSGLLADSGTIDNEGDDVSRKRAKPDVEMRDVDDSPAVAAPVDSGVSTLPPRSLSAKAGSPNRHRPSPKSVRIALDDAVVEQSETVANTSTDDLSDSTTPPVAPPTPPPATSLPQHQPRNRPLKRAGTPPFPTATKPKPATASSDATITDSLRASLTWHDDEITIYDPDDSDDDGTGINGIGFKPTPAIAYARTVRRKQQLAEYRKREERDARAKRSMRRRGASPAPGILEIAGINKSKGKGERRRVRFLEGGAELIEV